MKGTFIKSLAFINSLDKTPFRTKVWPFKVHAYGFDNNLIGTMNLLKEDERRPLRYWLKIVKALEQDGAEGVKQCVWYVRKQTGGIK